MCGWTLKPIFASSPARARSLAKPDGVNGPPRSEAKTKGEADWRLSSRSARHRKPTLHCCCHRLGAWMAAWTHGPPFVECVLHPVINSLRWEAPVFRYLAQLKIASA